jgi:L-iditol 2-dehydrogenase
VLAALLYGQEDLRLETVDDPTPGDGEVVIEVGVATTCGTDLKVWRRGGHAKMLKLPTLFGHEAAGRIVEIDKSVKNWKIGDRVVANNSAPCMQCFFCKRQEFSLCTDLSFNNGTFAQYLRIPSAIVQHNLLPIPDHVPDAIAAMTEPLACVLHGVARSNYKIGDRIVLLGDGAIGLMFVAAMAPKTEFYVFGGNDDRLEIAKKFGAAKTFNYRQVSDVPELVKELTDGWGADVVIEATGIPSAWETAIACARPGATVNLFGGCPRNTAIPVNTEQLHYNELTLKGVFHNTPKFVRSALDLLASGTIPFELLISDRQPLQNLEQVFQDMKQRKVIKVAIEPNER